MDIHPLLLQHPRNGFHHGRGRIESGEDAVADARGKLLVFGFITRLLPQQGIQLAGGSEERTVRTAPLLDVTLLLTGVENELQATEAAEPAEHGFLLLRGSTPGTLDIEGYPDGRDVVSQLLSC